MSLRTRLAAAFALVAVLTAAAVAVTAPTIIGRGFTAMETDGSTGPGRGQGPGPGPMAGLHAQEIQRETTLTLVAVAVVAAGAASLMGVVIAGRLAHPLRRLERSAAAVARGELSVRSGLSARTDELGSVGRSFDTMASELEADERARRRFFQDAAHELKTPLAVIDATTSAVLDGVYGHDDRHLETIRHQSQLLGRIVDDLRTVSLADAGALPLRRERVGLASLLASIERDFTARALGANVDLRVAPADADLAAFVDPDRIRQAVAALVDNAIRHTPEGGRVDLGVRGTNTAVTLSVVDSGPGIAEADLPYVFDRFFKADPARDRSTGTSGLGLAIVRAVAEAHGGLVRAANEPGGGARFEIELSLAPPAVAAAAGGGMAGRLTG